MNDIAATGLGHVGSPPAGAFAETGADVIGTDTVSEKLTSLNEGISRVEDMPDVPSERVGNLAKSCKLRFTKDDHSGTGEAGAVIIRVPTPRKEHREPDVAILKTAMPSKPRKATMRRCLTERFGKGPRCFKLLGGMGLAGRKLLEKLPARTEK